MAFHTPTRPPRPSRVRGASCSLTSDNDMHTLPNVIQLALLRIKTIDIPQLVREAVEPYKAKVNNLSEDVTSLRAQNERLQQKIAKIEQSDLGPYRGLEQVDIPNMIKEAIEPYKKEIQELKIQRKEIEEVKENVVKLECYSRRDNLKFFGVRELPYESKFDCKQLILQILYECNINLPPKAIETAHRLGTKHPKHPRPIIVKFFHAEEKQLIVSKSRHIWNTIRIRVEEDFAPKVEENRKILRPILNAAQKSIDTTGKPVFNANLRLDKLSINGKVFTVNDLDKLPQKLNPEKLSTITKGNTTAFFRKSSPLSYHHLAEQKIDGKTYNCNEQFYMSQKATLFKDHAKVAAIMKESDPGKQKGLGDSKKIKNFSHNVWDDRCLEIMKRGLVAKFSQNKKLKDFLLETGTTVLVEGNPGDTYWGAGLAIHNPRIWEKNSWLIRNASNHLGRLLTEVRRDIKSNIDG